MSERKQIVRAAGVLGFATVLSRIMGMVRDMVVSRLFGAGFATDAFFAAFMIPNMLRRFFAEGALTSAFVPTFSETLSNEGEDEARKLTKTCFTLLLVVMAAVTAAGILFSPAIVSVMFPGFAKEPSKLELTVLLNRIMFPYIFFISLVALCMGILNTLRHFFTPAISTVFLNLSMIGCAVFLHDRFHVPIVSLALGVLAGGALQLILQLPALYSRGYGLGFRFDFRNPAVKRITLLMVPSVFGVGVYYLNLTVSNILASLLPQGSVSYLYYAQRLFEFPQGIFTVSVAQAVLPSMSRQAAAGDMEALKDSLTFGLKLTLFITIPAMAGLMVASTPIFSLLFMGGAFGYDKAVKSSEALFYYSMGLSVIALVRVLVPAFYAMKDTRTPVVTAFFAFLLNLGFSLLLMRPLLHGGLALATTLSAVGNLALLLWFLRKKIGRFGGRAVFVSGAKAAVASVPMALLVGYVLRFGDWSATGHKLEKGLVLSVAVGGGIAVYLVCARLAGCEEVTAVGKILRKRFNRRIGGE
jgi:putative peptidoglycan lipid II flippase